MTPRPECPLCRQPIVRAQTSSGTTVMFNPLPTHSGLWRIDFDHAVPLARRQDYPPPGPPVLHERHFNTCPRRTDPTPDPPPAVPLPALIDALAVALARRTHEFTPGEDPTGAPTDLCAHPDPHTCGRVPDHPVHATPRAIHATLAARAAT